MPNPKTQIEAVEVSWFDEAGDPMFTEIHSDGTRRTYWLPFWSACWEIIKLTVQGIELRDCM